MTDQQPDLIDRSEVIRAINDALNYPPTIRRVTLDRLRAAVDTIPSAVRPSESGSDEKLFVVVTAKDVVIDGTIAHDAERSKLLFLATFRGLTDGRAEWEVWERGGYRVRPLSARVLVEEQTPVAWGIFGADGVLRDGDAVLYRELAVGAADARNVTSEIWPHKPYSARPLFTHPPVQHRDSARLDFMEREHIDTSFVAEGAWDAYRATGDDTVVHSGKSLREALDSAMQEKKPDEA